MTDEKTRALIAEARTDISDAERCEMLGVTPAAGTLLRMLRKVTDALSALTVPDGDAREAVEEEATRRWGEFASTDTRQGAFERDAFVAGAMWALSRAAAPETEWEYAVRWVQTDGQPITDIGADEADVRALVETQDGWCEGVRRQAGPWEPLTVGGETE